MINAATLDAPPLDAQRGFRKKMQRKESEGDRDAAANRKSPIAKTEDAASGMHYGAVRARRGAESDGLGGSDGWKSGDGEPGGFCRIWAGWMMQPLSGLGSFSRLLTQG